MQDPNCSGESSSPPASLLALAKGSELGLKMRYGVPRAQERPTLLFRPTIDCR